MTALLFSPIQIGAVRVANRVVFSAHLTNYAENNLPGERLLHYYRERARGGAGLVITEEQSVHPSDFAYEKLIHAYDPTIVPYYRRLTTAIHAEGAAIFCQLNHNGLQGFSFFNDEPLWGPSSVSDGLFGEQPRSIRAAELEELIAGYVRVARHAREGGFDGVELQASHSSLLRQFLSPYTNHRQDAYGGSFEKRLRLTVECLSAVRDALGGDLAVGIRLCTDELVDGGLRLEDMLQVARRLDELGLVDFINTSIGTTGRLYMVEGPMVVPAGYQTGHTAAVREQVRVPVIGVGRVNDPVMAERLIAEGVADLIGVVRGQIADAEWAAKARRGEAAQIRKCIACNQYCIGLMGMNTALSCIQNPANGEERRFGVWGLTRHARARRIWVIGAGPAGLEAAITAGRMGHEVHLWEREDRVGGMVNWIVKVVQRSEYGDLIRNKLGELRRAGVQLHLGCALSSQDVLEATVEDAVEVVIVATGQAESRPLHVQGMEDSPRVRTPLEVLAAEPRLTGTALIVDEIGGHQATSLAEYLAEGGCAVHLLSSAFAPGQQLGVSLDLELWHTRIARLEITLHSHRVVLDVREDPVLLEIFSGAQETLPGVDWIIPVNPGTSRTELFFALQGHLPALYRVGDALAPKDVGEAILDGQRAALRACGEEVLWW